MIQDRSSSYFNFSIMHRLINAQMHEINSSAAIQIKAATILDRPSGCTIAATIKQYWQSCINLIFKIINRAGNQNSQVTILFTNTKSSQFSYLYRQVPIHSIFHFLLHLLTVELLASNPSLQENLHSESFNISVALVLHPRNTALVGNGHATARKVK